MHIDSQVIMNLAFSKTRTDDITHVRTPWLLGDAIPFTRPSCGPASQAKARGARDWQPGRRTGRRKRKRREKDEMHLLLPGEARGSRNTEDERPHLLRGLFFRLFAGLFWTQYSPKHSKLPSTPCLRSSVLHLHSGHGCGSQLTNSSCFPGTRWLLAPQVPRQTGIVDHPTRQPVIRHLPCLDLLAFQELPLHKPRPSQQKF
ncbi:uncharacterized protein isoform X1 [Macaca fascicularis]|uniref:uncharacterized protein isoform X1 n=1 Tax=Macaca fascicularis TaxID=9541 RepID=UPI0032B040B3